MKLDYVAVFNQTSVTKAVAKILLPHPSATRPQKS